MHSVRLNNQAFTAPDKWEEVKAKDLLTIAKVSGVQDISREFHNLMVCHLFGISAVEYKKLTAGQRAQLKPLIYWLYTPNKITKWLLSAIRIGGFKTYGPDHQLANLTAEEFMYAEAAYERWSATKKVEYLDTLVAVLYRRKWFFNTYRSKFNVRKLPQLELRASKLKTFVKKSVALNYAGCRNNIIERHPNIWKKALEAEGKKAGAQHVTNWTGIILDLAGDKFGTYEQTVRTNIWLVLADLDKKVKLANELEGRK